MLAASVTSSFVTNLNWSTPSWDLFIILFFIVAGFLYGLSLGRDRIIVILISIYMALAIVNTVPFLPLIETTIKVNDLVVFKISTFLAAFIILFFLLSRSALLRTVASADSQGSWWQVIIFSILHIGLLISITLTFLPKEIVEKNLSVLTQMIFVGDWARFLWIVMPVVMMALLKGGASQKRKVKEYEE